MPTLTVKVTGEISIARGSSFESTGETPVRFEVGIADASAAQSLSIGQTAASVASPSSFVDLPFPANLRARIFHLRVRTGGPLVVELTHAAAGVKEYPGGKSLLVELDAAEQVSAVRVKGTATDFEWVAVGAAV